MATDIFLNESSASRRCVPVWCVQSNGTTPAALEAAGQFTWSLGGVSYGTGGTLSAVSAVDGQYMANFRASVLSLVGPGQVMYSSGTALPTCTAFQVVAYDPYTAPQVAPSNWSAQVISAAGQVSVNSISAPTSLVSTDIRFINAAGVSGSGTTADPWRPT